MAYNRALRATVATDQGPLAVYVAHLGSVRVNPRAGFWTDSRDRNAQALGEAIAAEQNERVVLLGDLNGTMDDRAFASITSQLRSAQDAAGDGFGFTWPAKFPVVRIDQILVQRREAGELVGAAGHRQRPPAGGGPNHALITAFRGSVRAVDRCVSGPPGTRTLNPSGDNSIIRNRTDRPADQGESCYCLTAVDSPCRRQLCPMYIPRVDRVHLARILHRPDSTRPR